MLTIEARAEGDAGRSFPTGISLFDDASPELTLRKLIALARDREIKDPSILAQLTR